MTRAEEIKQEQDNIVRDRIMACNQCRYYYTGCLYFTCCAIYNHYQQQIHKLEKERKMLSGSQPPINVTMDEFIEICKNT